MCDKYSANTKLLKKTFHSTDKCRRSFIGQYLEAFATRLYVTADTHQVRFLKICNIHTNLIARWIVYVVSVLNINVELELWKSDRKGIIHNNIPNQAEQCTYRQTYYNVHVCVFMLFGMTVN